MACPHPDKVESGCLTLTGPPASAEARYVVALAFAVIFALFAKNLVRGRVGRSWMAIRDRDIAAEIIGVRPLRTKLLAFGISSFYCGVAGAEYVFLYLGSAETLAFDINLSFLVLFMVIIGGLGSILGSFLGAAFIVIVPIFLTNAPHAVGLAMPVALQKQIELMAKAKSLVRRGRTPMISAAMSRSRIAIQERPTRPRTRFFATRAKIATSPTATR